MLLWPTLESHTPAYPLHSIVNLGQPWFNVKGTLQRARMPGDKDHWGNLEGWVEWVSPKISVTLTVCVCVCVLSCIQLFVTLLDYSLPDSSVHGIFQARILDGLPFPPPGDLYNLGIQPGSPALQTNYRWAIRKLQNLAHLSLVVVWGGVNGMDSYHLFAQVYIGDLFFQALNIEGSKARYQWLWFLATFDQKFSLLGFYPWGSAIPESLQ